jgi:hypothetical protein
MISPQTSLHSRYYGKAFYGRSLEDYGGGEARGWGCGLVSRHGHWPYEFLARFWLSQLNTDIPSEELINPKYWPIVVSMGRRFVSDTSSNKGPGVFVGLLRGLLRGLLEAMRLVGRFYVD